MMLLAEGFTAQSIPLQTNCSVGLYRKNQPRMDVYLFSSIRKINNDDDAGDGKKKKKTQLVIMYCRHRHCHRHHHLRTVQKT